MAQHLEWDNPRFKSMGFEFLDEKIFIKRITKKFGII